MLVVGLLMCYGALAMLLYAAFRSSTPRLPVNRRRPPTEEVESVLGQMAGVTASAIDEVLNRYGWTRSVAVALEHAGLRLAPADFLIIAGSASLTGGAVGFMLGGLVPGLLLCAVCAFGARAFLRLRASRRRRAFGNQLEDTLQLLSGSLRAGHSLLRAIDSVADQADSPTAEEFARIVNETRLGRDLDDALDQTTERMQSTDFSWVAQAVGIHREVGGNLAEVLDQVAHTIRERNKIKRQIKALSAEGTMSAYILLALPVLIIVVLSLMNPAYMGQFLGSWIGYAMIATALVMIAIAAFWMRKIVSFKF